MKTIHGGFLKTSPSLLMSVDVHSWRFVSYRIFGDVEGEEIQIDTCLRTVLKGRFKTYLIKTGYTRITYATRFRVFFFFFVTLTICLLFCV